MLLDDLLNNPRDNQEPEPIYQKQTLSALALHKYVWGLIGIGLIFFATFFLAYQRVANSGKFETKPVNSLNWQENQKSHLPYPEPEH